MITGSQTEDKDEDRQSGFVAGAEFSLTKPADAMRAA